MPNRSTNIDQKEEIGDSPDHWSGVLRGDAVAIHIRDLAHPLSYARPRARSRR